MTDPITPARLRETLDRALADYIPGINCAVHFVSIEQVDMLAEFYLHTRADLSDALLREAAEALGMAVDDLDEWVACGDSLAQAGFNMDGTADCAERARATLAKLRAHLDGRADEGGVPNGI